MLFIRTKHNMRILGVILFLFGFCFRTLAVILVSDFYIYKTKFHHLLFLMSSSAKQ